jgi:hypothetical protein
MKINISTPHPSGTPRPHPASPKGRRNEGKDAKCWLPGIIFIRQAIFPFDKGNVSSSESRTEPAQVLPSREKRLMELKSPKGKGLDLFCKHISIIIFEKRRFFHAFALYKFKQALKSVNNFVPLCPHPG